MGVLNQAPVPAQILDKGIPTAGLLVQVLVANRNVRDFAGMGLNPINPWDVLND